MLLWITPFTTLINSIYYIHISNNKNMYYKLTDGIYNKYKDTDLKGKKLLVGLLVLTLLAILSTLGN